MTQNNMKSYKEMMIPSDRLEVPRSTYQRELILDEVLSISKNFNECIANEPKVSFRDGRYFIFDGQHTVAARVHRNGGNPLPILCKVYFGLTEKEEARLFAAQTGFSTDLGAGAKIRAMAGAGPARAVDGFPGADQDDRQKQSREVSRKTYEGTDDSGGRRHQGEPGDGHPGICGSALKNHRRKDDDGII